MEGTKIPWHWIGLVGENLHQKPWVFTIKISRAFRWKFSIIQFYDHGYVNLLGGFNTYPSEKWWSESQLGWWHSQLNGKIKHVPNHQLAMGLELAEMLVEWDLFINLKTAMFQWDLSNKNVVLFHGRMYHPARVLYLIIWWDYETNNFHNI